MQHRGGIAAKQNTHLGAQPFPDSPYGVVAGFDQREFAVIAADVEPQKVTPLVEVDDLGLGRIETKTSGPQPLGQLLLDLFRVLMSAAERQQIVGIADRHRSLRRCLDTASTASEVADPGRRFHPVRVMFKIRGLITPPCGAPSSVGAKRPFSIPPPSARRGSCPS
jgi:hypothetical protein